MSESNAQWLRAGFAALRTSEPRPDPVAPETVWAAAHGDADLETTQALLDRMVHDPDLAEEWRIALADRQDNTERPSRRPWGPSPYIAAAVAIAAAVVVWVIPHRPTLEAINVDSGTPGTYRGDPDTPGWVVERDGGRLRWMAVEGARTYRVRVLTEDFQLVLETRTTSPEVELPAGARDGQLRWEIDAVRADGTVARRGSGDVVKSR